MVFGVLVFKLSVWCGAEGCVSGLRAAVKFSVFRKESENFRFLGTTE